MKTQHLAGIALGTLMLWPTTTSAKPRPKASHQASASKSNGAKESANDKLPFPDVPRITAQEVAQRIKDKVDVVLVDTDDSVTYGAEHIKGAVNIAYDPTQDVTNEDQTLQALPGDKLIVFYCNCPHEEDSAPVVKEMWQLGYARDKVKALEGGLSRWEQLGYPLVGTDLPKGTQEKGE
ncbi:MAG: rhodanese-like domain-containing protein [Acidobacteriota bacterium]|nr:rhodanese-like domain-containing protein [Acidobacteriota bacterium]